MTVAELAKLFRAERSQFSRRFPDVRRAALRLDDKPPGSAGRAYAHARLGRGVPVVTLYVDALSLPRENVVGLIRHELGHVADPCPTRPGAELRADALAEAATGQKIRYDRRAVQTTGRGSYPRPCWLHQ